MREETTNGLEAEKEMREEQEEIESRRKVGNMIIREEEKVVWNSNERTTAELNLSLHYGASVTSYDITSILEWNHTSSPHYINDGDVAVYTRNEQCVFAERIDFLHFEMYFQFFYCFVFEKDKGTEVLLVPDGYF